MGQEGTLCAEYLMRRRAAAGEKPSFSMQTFMSITSRLWSVSLSQHSLFFSAQFFHTPKKTTSSHRDVHELEHLEKKLQIVVSPTYFSAAKDTGSPVSLLSLLLKSLKLLKMAA